MGGDTTLKAAEIQNNNGSTRIQTQGNLDIGAIQTGVSNKGYANEKNYNYSTTQVDQGSSIQSQGTVDLSANKIQGKAVDLESQQGDIVLNAQQGISLENGKNLHSTDIAMSAQSGGLLGSKTERNDISKSSQSIANQLNAAGNIIFNTEQGDITATHLKADAGETIQIQAKNGDVTLNSALNETSQSSTSSNTNFATYKNRQTGYIDQEVAQTKLTAGKNVDINAGKNIELQANDVNAGQSIYIGNTLMQRQADGTLKSADGSLMPENVTLSTIETHDQQWDEQQKGYRGIVKELVKVAEVGLAGVQSLFPGVNVDTKLTVAESSSQREEQTKQTGTSLVAENAYVGSAGNTTLTSADITTKNTVLSGQKVTLNAAEEQNISAQSHSKETIEGLGVKLNKDNVRLGGFVSEDTTQSTKTTETTHKAGSINTENLKIQGAEGIDILGQNIKATGDTVLDHGRGDLNIGGYENKTTVEDKTHTETISAEVGVRNAYLDAALAVGAVKDAAEAVKQAKDQYSQAQRDYASGKITKGALDDTKANVAMATANLANAQIAVGSAAATAAASSATYGFTIGANGERIETTTTTNTTQGKWQGSQLELNNLTLKSENQDVNFQGSRLTATGLTTFEGTKDLNVSAGKEQSQQDTSSKTNNQSVSYTYGGGGSASVGKQTSKSHNESLTHVNSQVDLNKVSGSMNKLNIQGGEVSIADRGDLKVNEIHVESLQDTASGTSSSKGGSVGVGIGSGGVNATASYNQAKGQNDKAWINDTSKLLIGNAQNDADLDAMGVKKVTNIGGVIANATKNEDGSLTDHGKLNYSGALELKDIQDHSSESNRGFNISTSVGTSIKGESKESSFHPSGSTTVGLQSTGNEKEQLTKATMGQGTVKNTTELNNRDISNTQEITRDQVTGLLNGSVTVDNRLLTESGRAQIIQEQKDLPENLKQATQQIKNDVEKLVLKLPDSKTQNIIITSLNQMVGGDMIADAYKEFLKNGGTKEEFFVVANNSFAQFYIKDLADANEKIQELESKGYSLEQILNTSIASVGNTNVISVEGQHKVNLTKDTTIGMQLLAASYGLSKGYSDFQQEMNDKYGVAIDPETLSLVIGTILTGPAKTVANVLLSSQYGEYIQKAKDTGIDLVSTSITAISYGTDTNVISTYTNPELRDQISKESVETQEWSKDVSEGKEGAKFLTNIIAGIVVGGVGKGVTKEKDSDIDISKSGFEIGGAKKDPVKELEVGSYKELKSRAQVGDDLEHDHIPSFAALKKAKENELGRDLTQSEIKTLYNDATVIEVSKDTHKAGRTHSGKNTPSQIEKDAENLCEAQRCDLDVLRKNLENKGFDRKNVDEAIQNVIDRNKDKGID